MFTITLVNFYKIWRIVYYQCYKRESRLICVPNSELLVANLMLFHAEIVALTDLAYLGLRLFKTLEVLIHQSVKFTAVFAC